MPQFAGGLHLGFNDPDGMRQNPVTGNRGIDPVPARGVDGRIRSSSNPNIGKYGLTRTDKKGNPKQHNGLDVNAKQGTKVRAAEAGTVTSVGKKGDYGNQVEIKHTSGETTSYSHLSGSSVQAGQTVREGQVIGEAGTTGNAAGLTPDQQHLHLEVRDSSGNRTDPEAWLNDPNADPAALPPESDTAAPAGEDPKGVTKSPERI